jgi:2-amino-4-hydroxy-6-hydroxymethyldihydropteridine diphosphokinase
MNKLIISIGSNSPDQDIQMENAISFLKSRFKNVLVSSIYESEALNGNDADYLNAVAIAETNLTCEDATKSLKEWEMQSGRTPESKLKGSIPIDLDIVVWNDNVVREKDFSYSFFTKGYKELTD